MLIRRFWISFYSIKSYEQNKKKEKLIKHCNASLKNKKGRHKDARRTGMEREKQIYFSNVIFLVIICPADSNL